jgi:hypothetical protein
MEGVFLKEFPPEVSFNKETLPRDGFYIFVEITSVYVAAAAVTMLYRCYIDHHLFLSNYYEIVYCRRLFYEQKQRKPHSIACR